MSLIPAQFSHALGRLDNTPIYRPWLVWELDKVLIGLIDSAPYTLYSECFEGSVDLGNVSFTLDENCITSSHDPDLYDLEQVPPCSVDTEVSPWSVLDPPTTYRLLTNGSTNTTSNYNDMDVAALEAYSAAGKMAQREVVTHYDKDTHGLNAFFVD